MPPGPLEPYLNGALPGDEGDSLALDPPGRSPRGFPPGSRFRNITFLGEGGMGRVFRAEDPLLGRAVALKLAHHDSDVALMRFTAEAQAQARIDHPNVVKVFEVGEVLGTPYIVMQLVEGKDLATAYRDLSLAQRVAILRSVANGVEAAHRLGLLHRDLKPQNILLEGLDSDDPRPFVTDFGLVKELGSHGLTETGVQLGTPRYMSPEQTLGVGGPVDVRTDIYALGATMYEVFGGGPLYGEVAEKDLFRNILDTEPKPLRRAAPEIPEDLALIVHTCLAQDRTRRYPSAQALAEDLDRYLQVQPVWARRPSYAYRLRRGLTRHRKLAVLAALGLLALLAMGAWFSITLGRSRREAQLAADFGRHAQRMETLVRLAYMAPAHPVLPQIQSVRREMAELEKDMRQAGAIAQGPGNWALGECLLAIEEKQAALTHLDRAWSAGFRTPACAASRGNALLDQFIEGTNGLSRIEDEGRRRQELAILEIRYKQPALDMLRQAASLPGVEALLAAKVALLEGREDAALKGADSALAAEPWRFEACVLKMQVWALREQRAMVARDATTIAHARAELEQAFLRARTIAPSNPALWNQHGIGRLDRSRGFSSTIGNQTELDLQVAKSDFDQALALNPRLIPALNNRSEVAARFALIEQREGREPEPWLNLAIEDAEASLRVDPDQFRGVLVLLRARMFKANFLVDAHRDAAPELRRCDPLLARLKASPQETSVRNEVDLNLTEAFLFAMGAQDAATHGRDGRPALRQAIRCAQQVLRTDPDPLRALGFNANLNMQLGDAEDRAGSDPSVPLAAAQEAYDRLIAADPKDVQVLRDSAEVHRIRASHQVRSGLPPGDSLTKALALVARGLGLAPRFHELHQAAGRTHLVAARWERASGRNPNRAVALARAALLRAKALNPRMLELDSDLQDIQTFERGPNQPGKPGLVPNGS